MNEPPARLVSALEDRYLVERELGEGGMATVYLAHDRRHDRRVALKVLRPELAAVVGAERFLAEIRTTANLQHPHILPLFDSGEADSFLFYVMPYVEGETLRERIDREKQLPMEEAVRIATAVAGALDHAHRHGIIHRDIKPANILIQDGEPVVADFGIALAVGAAGGGRLTETGLSLGTPYYMSPEQAMGDHAIGPATDVYALGCVLHEMLVGEPPYLGKTAQAVLGKIIAGEAVSPARQRPSMPAHVDAAIRRALEKLPADRFASAQDLARALADPAFRHGEAAASGRGAPARWKLATAGGWAAFAVTLAVAAARAALADPEAERVARFAVALGEDAALVGSQGVNLALSPDGSRIVYAGPAESSGTRLWQRPLSQLEPQPLPGSEGARNPVFSPDGASVAFSSGGALKTLPLAGGPAFTVVAEGVPDAGGGIDWGEDGMLYFNTEGALHRVPSTGGSPLRLTTPEPSTAHAWVEVVPGGGLVFTIVRGAPDSSLIATVGREGGEPRVLLRGAMARYAPSGHLAYAAGDGTLMAAPFSARRMRVTGGRWLVSTAGGSEPRWAHSGRELFYRSADGVMTAVEVETGEVFRAGTPRALFPMTGYRSEYSHVSYALTPDDQRFLMVRPEAATESRPRDPVLVQGFFAELRARFGR